MINPLTLVRSNLQRHLVQTLGILVLLSLVLGLGLGSSLLVQGLQDTSARSAADFDLVIGGPGNEIQLVMAAVYLQNTSGLRLLEPEILDRLALDTRVAAACPLVFADSWKGFPVVGAGKNLQKVLPSLKLSDGRWPENPFEVVAGAATGLKPGEEFHSTHQGGGEAEEEGHAPGEEHQEEYRVVGVLAPLEGPWDRSLITPAESIWDSHEHREEAGASTAADDHEEAGHDGEHEGEVSAILVKPASFAASYALRDAYRRGDTSAAFPGEVLSMVFGVMEGVKSLASVLALALELVVFLAVILSILATLPGRLRHLGILRSLGAGRAYLFWSLWLETALVFTLSAGLAAVLALTGISYISTWLSSGTGLVLGIAWSWNESLMLLLFMLAGILGSVIPALAAYRHPALEA